MSLRFKTGPDGRRRITNRQIDFFGWVVFTFSAICFIIGSIGYFWSMAGSVIFLIGCLVFMIPFFRKD